MNQALRIVVGIASVIFVLTLPILEIKGKDSVIWGITAVLGALGVALCFGGR